MKKCMNLSYHSIQEKFDFTKEQEEKEYYTTTMLLVIVFYFSIISIILTAMILNT